MTPSQEIKFWQKAKRIVKAGYGANCKTRDTDDFPKLYKKPKDVFRPSRCPSCRAKEVVEWIDRHIARLKRRETADHILSRQYSLTYADSRNVIGGCQLYKTKE